MVMGKSLFLRLYSFFSIVSLTLSLSGCEGVSDYAFNEFQSNLPPPNSDICVQNPEIEACKRKPNVSTPGIVTILFTMQQIPQGAATLILANAIKFASPIENPKILFLKDTNTNGEDEGDPTYIMNTLLAGYDIEYKVISASGLLASEVTGKDLVIVSNPGHPLSSAQTLSTLGAFAGGVILLGDDLAHGSGFSMNTFTGLQYNNNGTSISCNGQNYAYDNLNGYNYQVTMNSNFLPGIPPEYLNYSYGNDIDHTQVIGAGSQVLAYAEAAPGTCDIGQIPAVVRRPR